MNPCTASFFITSLACNLFQCLPEDELAVLAADLTQLGDTLASLLARAELCSTAMHCSAATNDII